jgi:hypothetical protein
MRRLTYKLIIYRSIGSRKIRIVQYPTERRDSAVIIQGCMERVLSGI